MVSDGLACFAGVTRAQCLHVPIVVGRTGPAGRPGCHQVNTVPGNPARTISSADRTFEFGKYTDTYLAAVAYRFNGPFDPKGLVARPSSPSLAQRQDH